MTASSLESGGVVSPLHVATNEATALTSPSNHGHHGDHENIIPETRIPVRMQEFLEPIFKLKKRKVTFELEVYCGIIQFISCLYVLPVVPFQMRRVGYDEIASIIATACTCGVGSIAGSFVTNLPLIIAPPTSVSIFLAVSMQQQGLDKTLGNTAVMWSGIGLVIVGALPPLNRLITRLIPSSIQASTAVGIGLITALAGATELNLVVRGKYTIVDMGEITDEIVVGIAALIIVAVCLHYHFKAAFCIGLIFGTVVWWIISGEIPEAIVAAPGAEKDVGRVEETEKITLLVFNLLFLYILTLNGLSRSMSDLAGLTKPNGAVPRGNFLYIVCGLTTILSGYFSGPPILISPESAAGIKAGAKTGLSTLVCGILFGISVFFYPVFAAVPAAGTAPLLIIVGVVLFNNVKRIDWTDMKEAVPAYCVLFFIPFTYSILRGVAFGYIIHIFIMLFTGEYITNGKALLGSLFEPSAPKSSRIKLPVTSLQRKRTLSADGGVLESDEVVVHDPVALDDDDQTKTGNNLNDTFNKFMLLMDTECDNIQVGLM